MQIKTFFFILAILYGHNLFAQKQRVRLGNKEETKKEYKRNNTSLFLKLYPFNLLRGDMSMGFEKALSRSFSIEPIVCMTFTNTAEVKYNAKRDFAERSYIKDLSFDYPNYKFMPSFGFKGTIKFFPDGHDDLEGYYYAFGYGNKNYIIRQTVNYGNGVRTTRIHDTEYKIMRGVNMMTKKNFNLEIGIGAGLRNIKYVKERLEEVYDPVTQLRTTRQVSEKVNYFLPVMLVYFNLGISIT